MSRADCDRTSMDGRVTYEDWNYSGIGGATMKAAGEQVAKAFPKWKVRVTAGPYRDYDVAYEIDREEKEIHIDFYSVRPGYNRLPELIEEVKTKLLLAQTEEGS